MDVRLLTVIAAGSTSPGEQDATTLGAFALLRYALRIGRLDLSAGPQAELLARPIVVKSDGNEVFRLPTLVAGVSLEAAVDFSQ